MHKQIIGYIPANVVPALVSFAMIFAYTRLLTPTAFGDYSLVFSGVLVAQSTLYFAVPIAVLRLHPAAIVEGREAGFLKEAYSLFYAVTAVVIPVCVLASLILDIPHALVSSVWLGLPLLILRSAVTLNQSVNRASDRMARYNLIECAHAVLGLTVGLLCILLIGRVAESVILGLLVAALLCASVDLRHMTIPWRRGIGRIERASLLRLINFAWPLITVAVTGSLLQLSDRFLLGGLGTSEMLGIYVVSYSLVERPTSLICTSISTATFSIAVQALEQRGRDAGRIQAGKNGAAVLALALPACVGLAMTSPYLANVLVGPDFRQGVAELIPIMAITALCHGMRAHFIDHAFHLAGRPNLMLWSYGPAALANVALNVVLIPYYGMFAAAWTGLACQIGAVLISWVVGRRVFPMWLPWGQVARTILAVLPMVVVLWVVEFPHTALGLVAVVIIGAASYGVAALLLNVGGARGLLRLPARMRARWPAGLHRV